MTQKEKSKKAFKKATKQQGSDVEEIEKPSLKLRVMRFLMPYYHDKPQELIDLEKQAESYKINPPDNVFIPPKGFRRPSLYHPMYLNEVPKSKNNNYSEPDDKIKANIIDLNPEQDDSISIHKEIYNIIDAKVLPTGDLAYAQNNETYELLMHVQAGSRSRFQRAGEARANTLRKLGRNKSRIKCTNDNMLDKNRNEPWAFCHLIPVGYHGSEGDERIGIRWWGSDNNNWQSEYEKRMEKLNQNYYWLIKIKKIETNNESGLGWDYYTYDENGELIDSMVDQMNHTVPNTTASEEANVWKKTTGGENWEWTFGVDEKTEINEDDEALQKAMDNYVYYPEYIGFESLVNKTVALSGEDDKGRLVSFDTAESEACHLLIAGTTGSGKSVEVVFIMETLKAKATPLDVQFAGVDPNKVEFAYYRHNPYWYAEPVDQVSKASLLTNHDVIVFEARANMFKKVGVENLKAYNKWVANNTEEAKRLQFGFLAHTYLVTDEFASLMLQAREMNEPPLLRIAAEGRKYGTHAFLATQRPSVDVIRGTLKSNFPAKIGLRLNNSNDSGTLAELDNHGINPHDLKGMGDNILMTQNGRFRSQGVYVSKDDVKYMANCHKYIYFGLNPDFNPELPEDDDDNPRYDYSKDYKEDIEGELVRSGKWVRSDDGSIKPKEEKRGMRRG
ncbi:TPA: FtsK/SpoIIIE domain-containing protein [Streptococcus agalactiae]|nr:DNA translocase FtsK [Streptococcus agalactiae]HEO2267402.1 DNA translocase FtsK [Streptococcus agalactiae]HEO7770328.1 DNA translocase FtsK [Streptococcus agalactiae]